MKRQGRRLTNIKDKGIRIYIYISLFVMAEQHLLFVTLIINSIYT